MRYPNIRQDGFKNCGPCVLASIIEYYGGYVSVDSLEDMMHTSFDGTSAYDIVMTARKLGFDAYGMKVDNLNDIDLPIIAHVTISSYNHYIVIYKKGKKILIGDPATKLRYISYDEFYKIWNNFIIYLKPIKKLPYIKVKSLKNYIGPILFKHIKLIIYLIIISILVACISLIYSIFVKYMIDNISYIYSLILIFICIFLLKYILIWIRNLITIKLNKKIYLTLIKDINTSLISLPYLYYKNHRLGEVVSRINDIDYIIKYINDLLLGISYMPIFILFILYMINSNLFPMTFLILIIYFIYNLISMFFLKNDIKLIQNEKSLNNSLMINIINGYEMIKGINIENNMINKLNNSYERMENTLCKVNKRYCIREIVLDLILNIGSIVIMLYGFILYSRNMISISYLISYYIVYTYLFEPCSIYASLIYSYRKAKEASRRIQELFYKFTSDRIIKGNIYASNITYGYNNKNIIDGLNISIKMGEKILIKGISGSGKSTLLKLIKGYDKSNIYINNELIDTKLSNVIYLSQEKIFFEDTLLNNLMCDDINRVKHVLELCHIKMDLYSLILEDGFNLNNGLKARIALARALLRPFDILLIDETLDEVDSNMENIILKNIFSYFASKTIIVVSHRASSIDLYDRVLIMDDGTLKEGGRVCGELLESH